LKFSSDPLPLVPTRGGEILGILLKIDGFVKSRHSGLPVPGRQVKTGVQRTYNYLKRLDSGFRRNDIMKGIPTFYETIKDEFDKMRPELLS